MAKKTKKSPDFFEENPFDPVNAAIGDGQKQRSALPAKGPQRKSARPGFTCRREFWNGSTAIFTN